MPRARRRFPIPLAMFLACVPLPAAAAAGAVAPGPVEVRVERARPERPSRPTFRFLRDHLDFLRGRLDRLRERTVAARGRPGEIDPRFLAYGELMAQATAARDSVGAAAEAASRHGLLASVTALGGLEAELDLLERQLASQAVRLAALERDFAGRQETELVVVVSGAGAKALPAGVTVALEQGPPAAMVLGGADHDALRRGGVVQLFHGRVEPREQVLELGVDGVRGYVSLDPVRDRRTILRIDLAGFAAGRGAESLRATVWCDDAGAVAVDR